MRTITLRRLVAFAALTAAAAVTAGLSSSANGSPFVPLAQFDCGSAGTFFSEVNPIPAPLSNPFAPPPEASVRLLTTTTGETNAVIVLLQVTTSTGQVAFTNPGLKANQANPNLVTCTITRPNGDQFEAIGLLTPAA